MPTRKTHTDKHSLYAVNEAKRSCFDGSVLCLLGLRLLACLMTAASLGFAYPWAKCMVTRWEAKHTAINGRRLRFAGKGGQLFGKYLLWLFLTIVTLGVYSVWLGLNMKRWLVQHTVYEDEADPVESGFTAGAGGWFARHLLCFVLSTVSLWIAYPWLHKNYLKWEAEHTQIGGSPLVFTGTGGQLLAKCLPSVLFTLLTLGLSFFVNIGGQLPGGWLLLWISLFLTLVAVWVIFPVKYLRWKWSQTQALYCIAQYRQMSRSHEEQAKADAARYQQINNDSQLERVKSGVTGEETDEELRSIADGGNRSAMYEYALRKKGDTYEDEALDYLRSSALAGYHPAMLDYARTLPEEQGALYAQLLEGSAENGNAEAPWFLKQYYENYANKLHSSGSYDSAEQLQRAAYWFMVAMEQGNPDALQNKFSYEKLVDTVALWMTERRGTSEKRGAGGVAAVILAVVLLLCGVGFWLWYDSRSPAKPEQEETPAVALWCDGAVVREDTLLYQQVPWSPRVVSFENFEVVNQTDAAAVYRLALSADRYSDKIQAVMVSGRVSEGDMERVMARLDNFVYLEDFSETVTVEPGQTLKFAVVLYWSANSEDVPADGSILPVQLNIMAEFSEK